MTRIRKIVAFYVFFCLILSPVSAQEVSCFEELSIEELISLDVTPAGKNAISEVCKSFPDAAFNLAQDQFPELFPGTAESQLIEVDGTRWIYRFWSETGVYAAVNIDDNGIYLLGGPFGDKPKFVGDLSVFLSQTASGVLDAGKGECINAVFPPDGAVVESARTFNDDNGDRIPVNTTSEEIYTSVFEHNEIKIDRTILSTNDLAQVLREVQSKETFNFNIVENQRFATGSVIDSTTITPDSADIVQSIVVDYTPSLYAAPDDCLRIEMKWTSGWGVEQTLTTSSFEPPQPDIVEKSFTQPFIATITSVNTPVTVAAGTFITTYEILEVFPDRFAIQHTDLKTGIPVKRVEYGYTPSESSNSFYNLRKITTIMAEQVELASSPQPLLTTIGVGGGSTTALVSGGISTTDSPPFYLQEAVITESEAATALVTFTIEPESEHVGLTADIVVVIENSETGMRSFMDSNGQLAPVDSEDPIFIFNTQTLEESNLIELGGESSAIVSVLDSFDSVNIRVGYIADGGIYYNSEAVKAVKLLIQ